MALFAYVGHRGISIKWRLFHNQVNSPCCIFKHQYMDLFNNFLYEHMKQVNKTGLLKTNVKKIKETHLNSVQCSLKSSILDHCGFDHEEPHSKSRFLSCLLLNKFTNVAWQAVSERLKHVNRQDPFMSVFCVNPADTSAQLCVCGETVCRSKGKRFAGQGINLWKAYGV